MEKTIWKFFRGGKVEEPLEGAKKRLGRAKKSLGRAKKRLGADFRRSSKNCGERTARDLREPRVLCEKRSFQKLRCSLFIKCKYVNLHTKGENTPWFVFRS